MTIACLLFPSARPVGDHLAARFPDQPVVVTGGLDELRPHLADARALVVSTRHYTKEVAATVAAEAPKLRWIQALSSGVDSLIAAGIPEGVTLTSGSGTHANAVADHALALALALYRRIPEMEARKAESRWDEDMIGREVRALEGQGALVVGWGPIGKAIARRLVACEMRVVAVSRTGQGEASPALRLLPVARLHDALPEADLLVLALPSTPESANVVDAAALARMKPSAILVNIARGSVVDQKAMTEALSSGRLAAAGLDVFTPEPLPTDDPLWRLPNVIISPHVAGNGGLSIEHQKVLVEDNLRRFLGGRPLRNVNAVPRT